MVRIILALIALSVAIPASAQTNRAKTPPETATHDVWPRLTAEEKAKIKTELQPGGKILVACASRDCRALAADVVAVFKSSGWETDLISHGGFGIDGVGGIRATSCGIHADRLKEAIERVTTRKIAVVEGGECADPVLYLTIGIRE